MDIAIISLLAGPRRMGREAAAAFGTGVAVEVVSHAELKKRSREVKTIVRTGDFTAWGNALLVSCAGPRWTMER